ncbi:substrate-binding domain-containing protein [Cupriavidus sp. RAF12]|uniref:substrate-binding domain-containing protein n=1 Tax=Cupriavidus sp. RAF12 TaxID=3233050 RepID=UPI003F91487C
MNLTIFSGGAAQAVVTGLQQNFEHANGCTLAPTFGAVGTMRDKLLAGEPCDLLVLSAALIEQLAAQGHVVPGSARALGPVATGVAVREGMPAAAVGTSEALKATLAAARGLYVPDMTKSSAGIHIAGMLKALGLAEALAGRIHEFPNGATAMRELARSEGEGMLGCTQVTEILYTPGVRLVGELPAAHALSTVYTAAVCSRGRSPALAAKFVEVLAGEESVALRKRSGFGF